MWVGVWLVNNNIMLFYLLYCFVIVISASSGKDITSRNVKVSSEGRIAGGEDASDVFIPYQVQISREGATFCSGVLYNEEHILTAAHCVQNANPDELIVRAGSVLGLGQVVPIEKIVLHPDYDKEQNNFDIAVLRTTSPLVFNRKMHGVLSVDYQYDDFGDKMQVSGWRYQEDGITILSDVLRSAILPVISNLECTLSNLLGITKNMICGHSARDMDCVGDGGSPAVIPNTRILLGIRSSTAGCGPGMGPSVFTFVQARDIREFIVNNTIMEPHSGHRRLTTITEHNHGDGVNYGGSGINYYADGDYDDANDHEHSFYGPRRDDEHSFHKAENGQFEHGLPENRQTGHRGPEHEQSGHMRPEHGQSRNGQTGHGQPEHWHSGHRLPGHGRHEHGQSGHGQSEDERPESSLELPKIPSEHERSEIPSEQTEDEGSEEPSEGSEHEQTEKSTAHIQRLSMRPQRRPIDRPQKRPAEGAIV